MPANDPVDEVFAAPLDEFVAARKRAVAELKKRGDDEAAAEASALRKPTVPVWIANQLARRHKQELRGLTKAADRLRKVQSSGDFDRFGEAQAGFGSALDALRDGAREILAEAGRPAGDPVMARVNDVLRAAASDPDAREALEAGRLTEELEAPGFAGLSPAAGARPASRKPREKTMAELAREAREEARREQRAALGDQLAAAQADAKRLRRELERAEKAVAQAQVALAKLDR